MRANDDHSDGRSRKGNRWKNGCANLMRNWFFPISAAAFFCLSANRTRASLLGVPIAFVIAAIAAAYAPPMEEATRQCPVGRRILSALTAVGICWNGKAYFCAAWTMESKQQALNAILPFPVDVPGLIGAIGAVVAFAFVYLCVLYLWTRLSRIFSDAGAFRGVTRGELIAYALLFSLSVAATAIAFTRTGAFYGTEYASDLIYTSDSPMLVKQGAYLSVSYKENDLRQPLFAVFSAPFLGIPYLLGKLLPGGHAALQAILMNAVQIALLYVAHYLLARMMGLSSLKRACFVALTSCTYTHMLFTLMMEQYVIAYFWLILCCYLICEGRRRETLVLWGAGGTLLTSMALLPLMSEHALLKQFRSWAWDVIRGGLGFIALMLAFCRFELLYGLREGAAGFLRFTGRGIPFFERLCQYTAYVRNCFFAPDAGADLTAYSHASWQLSPAGGIHVLGVGILAILIVSAALNWRRLSSRLAMGWVCLSAVVLLFVGWGTAENGLILYSLYFGWAFFALAFQLIDALEERLRVKNLTLIVSVAFALLLAIINVPAIVELTKFAAEFFPA